MLMWKKKTSLEAKRIINKISNGKHLHRFLHLELLLACLLLQFLSIWRLVTLQNHMLIDLIYLKSLIINHSNVICWD